MAKAIKILVLISCITTFSILSIPNGSQAFGEDILLIINYNFPHYESIDFLKKIYSPYFPHIVFYGPQAHNQVEVCDHRQGWYSYKSIALAMQKYPNYAGYLLIHDDLIINPKNFERFNKNNLWMDPYNKLDLSLGLNAITIWHWWQKAVGYTAIKKVYDSLDPIYHNILTYNIGNNMVVWGYADIVYIPSHCTQKFIQLSTMCEQQNVFLEIAIPTICVSIIPKEQIEYIKGAALWSPNEQSHPCDYLKPSVDYVHAIKLSNRTYRAFVEHYFEEMAQRL